VPRGFKVNIDGDRIAGRKRFVQRLVKQVILMCYRGWKRFLRIFRGEHDFAAFFHFPLLSISGVCTSNLGSEPLGLLGSGGTKEPTKATAILPKRSPASRVATALVAKSVRLPRNIASGGHMHTPIMDALS
jgi:hypothetical protein